MNCGECDDCVEQEWHGQSLLWNQAYEALLSIAQVVPRGKIRDVVVEQACNDGVFESICRIRQALTLRIGSLWTFVQSKLDILRAVTVSTGSLATTTYWDCFVACRQSATRSYMELILVHFSFRRRHVRLRSVRRL